MEEKVKEAWSTNTTLKNENNSKVKEISKLKEMLAKLKATVENGNTERELMVSFG